MLADDRELTKLIELLELLDELTDEGELADDGELTLLGEDNELVELDVELVLLVS